LSLLVQLRSLRDGGEPDQIGDDQDNLYGRRKAVAMPVSGHVIGIGLASPFVS